MSQTEQFLQAAQAEMAAAEVGRLTPYQAAVLHMGAAQVHAICAVAAAIAGASSPPH